MAKQSPVEAPAISNEPADRKVAEARPNGVIIDHRTGTISAPKKPFIQKVMERRNASKTAAAKAEPTPPRNARPGRPAMAPRGEFDPRTHEVCYEVRPTVAVDEMAPRERVRYQVIAELAGPIGIWVLISAIGRGGNKEAAVFYATCQMAAETERNNAIRILFRWALTFEIYPIALLEDGDFERWDNIAYRLEKWATERKHPELANLQTVLKVNKIARAEPNTPVVQVELPYEQVRRIAYDMGIEPIATLARVAAVRKDIVVDNLPPSADDYVDPPAPEPVVTSPVVAPAPNAEVTDELEPDEPTEEVPRAVVEPVREEVAPPAAEPRAEPAAQPETPATMKVGADVTEAAKLAGHTVEDFLKKSSPFRNHYLREAKRHKSTNAK